MFRYLMIQLIQLYLLNVNHLKYLNALDEYQQMNCLLEHFEVMLMERYSTIQ